MQLISDWSILNDDLEFISEEEYRRQKCASTFKPGQMTEVGNQRIARNTRYGDCVLIGSFEWSLRPGVGLLEACCQDQNHGHCTTSGGRNRMTLATCDRSGPPTSWVREANARNIGPKQRIYHRPSNLYICTLFSYPPKHCKATRRGSVLEWERFI